MKLKNFFVFVLLITIYCVSIAYRVRLSKNPEYYDPQDPTAFYWTENALQYHYAELVANGLPIPDFDPELQVPEGVNIFENLTIMMEYPCGWLYRFLKLKEKKILFHTWTILFIAGLASLGIFGVYLICRAIGVNELYAIVASLLSNFSPVAVGRSTFGFLNEDFALPFILFGIASYLYALFSGNNKILFSIIAGLCFLISLGAWHFSRFIFFSIVIISVVVLWIFESDPCQRKNRARVLLYVLLIPFAGSFLIPVLRYRLFFLSPAFFLGFGAGISILFTRPENEKPLLFSFQGWLTIIPALIFFAIGVLLSRILSTETEYTHVWSLIMNKIKFFGIKPVDPELLDYPARSLWIEAFNSPHPVSLFKNLFPVIIPALLGFLHLIKKRWFDNRIRIVILLSLVFFLSYLAIERMGVVNNYFVAILAVATSMMDFGKTKKLWKTFRPILLIGIFLFNFYQGYHLHETTTYTKVLRRIFGSETEEFVYNWRLNNLELVRFIKFMTPQDAIFLSSVGVGPLIFTYANRAIALQPKYEVKNCQKRVQEFLNAVYGSAEDLFNLCRKWQIDYFVYDTKLLLDNSHNSSRWVAGKRNVATNTAVFLLHFFPDELRHFALVYESNFYRVFRVLLTGERPEVKVRYHQPVYELKSYGNQPRTNEFFDDSHTRKMLSNIGEAKYLLQKANNLLPRDPEQACLLMEKSMVRYPSLIGSATTAGIAYALTNRIERGLVLCLQEIGVNPLYPTGHYNLAYCLYLKGDIPAAIGELQETLRLDSAFVPAAEMLNQLK